MEGVMSDDLTHMDKDGSARMVDVSAKHETKRMARAEARVSMREATLQAIREANLPKGDALSTARLAAIFVYGGQEHGSNQATLPMCEIQFLDGGWCFHHSLGTFTD